jgi:hypothetical protein
VNCNAYDFFTVSNLVTALCSVILLQYISVSVTVGITSFIGTADYDRV